MKITIGPASDTDLEAFNAYVYDPPYDFYDGGDDPMDDAGRVYAARDQTGELVGFFSFEERATAVEIGLGLRPGLTGRGLGADFVRAGTAFARKRFGAKRIVLNVAAFNDRAIAVYERTGFRRTGEHVRTFARWGEVPFVEMELVE